MTYQHECQGCGAEFRTLTKKRLHDCAADQPGGPEEWDETNLTDLTQEEIVDSVVSGLMKCVHCGTQLDEAVGNYGVESSAAGFVIVAEYDCLECGGHQRNTAEVA